MKKIYECRVLHDGWELDNKCWVIENEESGSRQIRTTKHGCECEMSKKVLDEKIKETRMSLHGLLKVKELIKF